MSDNDLPLPWQELQSQELPEFGIDPDTTLTHYYQKKIITYIGHPPPFSEKELMEASIMFNERHSSTNPLLFRSIVGVTKKKDDKEFQTKKGKYLAFQRALYSFNPRLPSLLQRAPTTTFGTSALLQRAPTVASFPRASGPAAAAAVTSILPPTTSIENQIVTLMNRRPQTGVTGRVVIDHQINLLKKQLKNPPDNGGGKKYKKRFTNKKRHYKKRSKSIKNK